MRYFIFLCISLAITAKVADHVSESLSARIAKVMQSREEMVSVSP